MLIGFRDMQENMFSCAPRRFPATLKYVTSSSMTTHHEVKDHHLAPYNYILSIAHFIWLAHDYTIHIAFDARILFFGINTLKQLFVEIVYLVSMGGEPAPAAPAVAGVTFS